MSPQLVVLVGPIAAGKSTVAAGLGARFRGAGRFVAVLDIDDTVDQVGGFVGLPAERFAQAQVAFGRLVGAWLDQGVDVVAHGGFLAPEEDAALLHAVPAGVTPRRVMLHASFPVALERVRDDPTRLLSRVPDLLRATHERYEALRPTLPAPEWTFDTSTTDADTIVTTLAAALLP